MKILVPQAEAALLWLRWLEKGDARLVWLRANCGYGSRSAGSWASAAPP